MIRFRRVIGGWAAVVLLTPLLLVASGPAFARTEPGGGLVAEVPSPNSPQVLNGQVRSVVPVGTAMVLGGRFSRLRDIDGSRLSRRNLVAFEAATGRIIRSFQPRVNGTVLVVWPARDGRSVYIGGEFTRVDGVVRHGLARISLHTGRLVRGFDAGRIDGVVKDLRLQGKRLWVAGSFSRIGARSQAALATVNARTGKAQRYLRLSLTGTHRGRGRTQVLKIDLSRDGRRLVAVGSFSRVEGVRRQQLFQVKLERRRAHLTGFATRFYRDRCRVGYTSVRDVAFSPDASYFVVVSSGGYRGPRKSCDTAARFETAARGSKIQPSWVASTGGDTLLSVETSNAAVYVGGHQRWFNNPYRADHAGPGAVSRPGIAALSPVNGLPFSWNPTRTLGVGVFDLALTRQGLWVASDTDRIAGLLRPRIALLPPAGTVVPARVAPTVPATVYSAVASSLSRRSWSGRGLGTSSAVPAGKVNPWPTVVGAFMVGADLHLAHADGTMTRRTFDGTNYGRAIPVAASSAVRPLLSWRDDIRAMTSVFYDQGRIYFTRSGSAQLFYRYYNPQSGVVGALRMVASGAVGGFDPRRVRGMLLAGGRLLWRAADGSTWVTPWRPGAQAGRPAGTSIRVPGTTVPGARSGVLFAGPAAVSGSGG